MTPAHGLCSLLEASNIGKVLTSCSFFFFQEKEKEKGKKKLKLPILHIREFEETSRLDKTMTMPTNTNRSLMEP